MQRIPRYRWLGSALLLGSLFGLVLLARAQASSPCGAHTPSPGVAHVCLSWAAPTTGPTIASYNVYRATATGGEVYTAAPLANVTTLFYYDASVVDGTEYFYTVISVGTGGALSSPSSEVNSTPVPPGNPVNPSASAVP
jgi:hypothetical protein